jgi:arginyl-tRNA synthetase
MGESFYNPFLGPMVKELMDAGHAVESDGAICIFLPGKKGPPLMI